MISTLDTFCTANLKTIILHSDLIMDMASNDEKIVDPTVKTIVEMGKGVQRASRPIVNRTRMNE